MYPGPVRVEMLAHGGVVPEHLCTSFVRARNRAGDLIAGAALWFDSENKVFLMLMCFKTGLRMYHVFQESGVLNDETFCTSNYC